MVPSDHRAALQDYGFSADDIERIEALWAEATALCTPAALDDLSIPYRATVCHTEDARRFSGLPITEWGGKTVLLWKVEEGRPMEEWRRARRKR